MESRLGAQTEARFWRVSSGDLRRVRVRAREPYEAFLIAVALYRPKSLGVLAEIDAEEIDEGLRQVEPTGKFYVSTHMLSQDYQEGTNRRTATDD